MWDAIVIGAGVGGLSSAAILSHSGKKVLVLEKRSRIGGRATSLEEIESGLIIDYGSHFFTAGGHVERVLRWIGSGVKMVTCNPTAALYAENRFVMVPCKIEDFKKFEYMTDSECSELMDIFEMVKRMSFEEIEEYDAISVEDWMKRHVQSNNLKHFFAWISNVWLTSEDMADISVGDVLRCLRQAIRNNGWFCYPSTGGCVAVSKGFRDRIIRAGGKVETGITLREIIVKNGSVKGVIAEREGGLIKEESHIVVFNPPLVELWRYISGDVFPDWFVARLGFLTDYLENKWPISSIGLTFVTSKPIHEYSCPVVIPSWETINRYGPRSIRYVWSPTNFGDTGPKGKSYTLYGNTSSRQYSRFLTKEKEIYKNEIKRYEEEFWSIFSEFDQKNLLRFKNGTINFVDATMRFPGNSWRQRIDVKAPGLEGLYFVGDMVRGWGMATDLCTSSGILCAESILGSKLTHLLGE
jgi:hypothetical protein